MNNWNRPEINSENINKSLTNNDFLYIFAVMLIILACFDLVGNIMGMGVWVLIRSEVLITTESNTSILNLLVNLGAQVGGILGFLILLSLKKLEPEEKTAPGGLHAFTTYNLHALNNAFAISVVLGLIYLLESVLGMTTESPYESIQPTLSLLDDPIYLLLFFGVLVVGAPVFEELVFRRTLIPLLERRGLGHFWVLVLSSLVFSLRHTPADLIDGSLGYAILHVFVTLPGGLALGFLYLRTRNVIWPIILHALINGLSGLAQIAEVQYNELGDLVLLTFVGLWAMAAVFIGFAAMLYFSYQFLLRRRDEIKPTWMQIIMDTSKNNRNLSKISRYLIIFILFTGGVPIIFSLLRENLLPPTISSPSDI
ncbi:MAG: CPBP family intramembrane glutamic endopeptidase, partial [Candidatus Hodarchaeales archaeon]